MSEQKNLFINILENKMDKLQTVMDIIDKSIEEMNPEESREFLCEVASGVEARIECIDEENE